MKRDEALDGTAGKGEQEVKDRKGRLMVKPALGEAGSGYG
jgi:hypothetical protein